MAKHPRPANQQPTSKRFNLFAEENRGLLLDLFVFAANLLLMNLLVKLFLNLFEAAGNKDPLAKLILIGSCVAMWVLPAAGAVLKRWHFHQRMTEQRTALVTDENALAGCLFNPIFYLCLNLVIMSVVVAAVGQELVGPKGMDSETVFIPSIFIGMALTIVQTVLIYLYFSPPKKRYRSNFLQTPQSAFIGDLCLFLNMLLFQLAWNLLTLPNFGRVSGVGEFFGRLFFLSFIALLIYFPPRMFYLAEDINRPRTWLTMLLANSPMLFKVLIGTSNPADW